jgi:hypothetical protein
MCLIFNEFGKKVIVEENNLNQNQSKEKESTIQNDKEIIEKSKEEISTIQNDKDIIKQAKNRKTLLGQLF